MKLEVCIREPHLRIQRYCQVCSRHQLYETVGKSLSKFGRCYSTIASVLDSLNCNQK